MDINERIRCLEELRKQAMKPRYESPNPEDNYEVTNTLGVIYEMERKKLLDSLMTGGLEGQQSE